MGRRAVVRSHRGSGSIGMSSPKLSLGTESLLVCWRESCQHHEVLSMELAAWAWQSVKPPERAWACPADHEVASLPWRIVFL